jgi:hypothetical protein
MGYGSCGCPYRVPPAAHAANGSDLRGLMAKAVKCRTGSINSWSDRPSVSILFDDFQRIDWTAGAKASNSARLVSIQVVRVV